MKMKRIIVKLSFREWLKIRSQKYHSIEFRKGLNIKKGDTISFVFVIFGITFKIKLLRLVMSAQKNLTINGFRTDRMLVLFKKVI